MGYTIALVIEYVIVAILVGIVVYMMIKSKKQSVTENGEANEEETAEFQSAVISEGVTVNININSAAEQVAVQTQDNLDFNESENLEILPSSDDMPLDAEAIDANVMFSANTTTFEEKFNMLSEEQKGYFNKLRDYALSKEKAEEKNHKSAVVVTADKKPILKLKIRRGITVASFKIESELMRNYKRDAEFVEGIKEKETEVYVANEKALTTACEMVDLMILQNEQKKQGTIARRRAVRRALRADNKTSQNEDESGR